MVGAYYFDGWAGKHRLAGTEAWAKDAPTHLTKRMLEEFPEREPIWGWRDDRPEIVEQQIDLAADHGIAFFAFCWYWHPTAEQIRDDPKHTGLESVSQGPEQGPHEVLSPGRQSRGLSDRQRRELDAGGRGVDALFHRTSST